MESRIQECHGYPYMGRNVNQCLHNEPVLMGFQMQIQLFSLTFLLAKRSQRRRARRNGCFRRLEQLMSFSSVQASITVVPSLKVWIQRTESSRRTRDETRVGNPWLPPLLSLIGAQIPRAKNLNGTKFWSQKISLPIARAPSFPFSAVFLFFFFFLCSLFFFALASQATSQQQIRGK